MEFPEGYFLVKYGYIENMKEKHFTENCKRVVGN
jgi:hypothetical protein